MRERNSETTPNILKNWQNFFYFLLALFTFINAGQGQIFISTQPDDVNAPAIYEVSATTGAQSLVSSGGLLGVPFSYSFPVAYIVYSGIGNLAIEPDGNILATTYINEWSLPLDILSPSPTSTYTSLIRINVKTHAQQTLIDGSEIYLGQVATAATGQIFISTEPNASAIYEVSATTGAQSLVSSGGLFGTDVISISGLAIEPDGNILVVALTQSSPTSNYASLIRINVKTHAQQTLIDGSQTHLYCVATSATGRIFISTEPDDVNAPAIYEVSATTGTQSLISSGGLLGGENGNSHISGLAIEPDGNILAVAAQSSPSDYNSLIRIDAKTHAQQTLIDGSQIYLGQVATGPLSASITPMRLTNPNQANVSSTDQTDTPIQPNADVNSLQQAAPLGIGVVADGVTPVVFQFAGPAGDYTLSFSNDASGMLSSNLFVIQNGHWVQSTNISITASGNGNSGTNFAYFQALDWTNFSSLTVSNDAPLTLNLYAGGSSPLTSTNFRVRPTPVILVHGYNADSSTWSEAFTNTLAQRLPGDFIVPIEYGVTINNGKKDLHKNTYGKLCELTRELDQQLEAGLSQIRGSWACTRYDVAAHSQGGVLTRMLCQTNLSGGSAFLASRAPISKQDYYRGRFRRVITIGSPHNGTVIMRYGIDRSDIDWLDSYLLEKGIIQPKFDPFGTEISDANNSVIYPIDSRMNFRCMQALVYNHNSLLFSENGVYRIPVGSFCGFPQGSPLTTETLLLPNGSDRIVDFDSQGGGSGTKSGVYGPDEVAHANAPVSFIDETPRFMGVPENQTETGYAGIASGVNNLLSGPGSDFGPFVLPTLLSPAEMCKIDSLATISEQMDTASSSTFGKLAKIVAKSITSLDKSSSGLQNCVTYEVELSTSAVLGGNVSWEAMLYGTNSTQIYSSDVSNNVISFVLSGSNSTTVEICIDGGVIGTVILYAILPTTNGSLFTIGPVSVLSTPPGNLTGILVSPNSLSPGVGESNPLELWGAYDNGSIAQLYIPPGTNAIWSSSNPGVVQVNTNGMISGISSGSAMVTANYLGFTAQAKVTVVPDGYVMIVDQPQSQVSNQGLTDTLTTLASGLGPLSYQWYFNNKLMTGATNANLIISNMALNNVGSYYAVVSNAVNVATSGVANATLPNQPLVIVSNWFDGYGIFNLGFVCAPQTYTTIETTSNLVNWVSLRTTFNTNSYAQFADSNSIHISKRFYRVTYAGTPVVSLSSPDFNTNGVFQFSLIGTAGVTNTIQTSVDLATWTTLTNIFNITGSNYFSDTFQKISTVKFYRALISQ